jgi:tuftelin-interacting protein 11
MIQQAAEERRAVAAAVRERAAKRKQTLTADPEHAKFESHSKGIGSKLLKAMGWKPGEGLGAKRDGIAKPLTAALRPKLAGLGAAGGEKGLEQPGTRPQGDKTGVKKMSDGGGESAFKLAWKARNRKRAAAKEVFKTANELLEEREGTEGGVLGAAGMTILDMTGPQTRVVTDMAQLSAKGEVSAGEDAHFPELQHNLKLLVELAEADIHQLVRPL